MFLNRFICDLILGFDALLFPPQCSVCLERRPVEGEYFCRGCSDDLDVLCVNSDSLLVDGNPLAGRVASAGRYEGALKRLVLRLKLGEDETVVRPLVHRLRLALKASNFEDSFDLIVPVPSRRRGLLGRSKTAFSLAASLAREVQVPIAPRILGFARRTTPQKMLSFQDRYWNMKGAFRCRQPAKVRQRRVLLIDDVMTTGATLLEAERALIEASPRSIRVLVCAWTPRVS